VRRAVERGEEGATGRSYAQLGREDEEGLRVDLIEGVDEDLSAKRHQFVGEAERQVEARGPHPIEEVGEEQQDLPKAIARVERQGGGGARARTHGEECAMVHDHMNKSGTGAGERRGAGAAGGVSSPARGR